MFTITVFYLQMTQMYEDMGMKASDVLVENLLKIFDKYVYMFIFISSNV